MVDTRIPQDDFINKKYDRIERTTPRYILLICSTPRSGSTLLCDILFRNNACIAHEYFHPSEYMSMLAERWGVQIDGEADFASYVAKLRERRTFPNGWLGINIQSEHLPIYLAAEPHLKDLEIHYVHLLRRDLIAQSVSYHIAEQTGQWSSKWEKRDNPTYDYNSIWNHLQRITHGNVAIQAFIRSRRVDAVTLYYEDLVKNTQFELCRLPCISTESPLQRAQLKRQTGELNREFADRFALENLSKYSTFGVDGRAFQSTRGRIKRWAANNIPGYWRLSR